MTLKELLQHHKDKALEAGAMVDTYNDNIKEEPNDHRLIRKRQYWIAQRELHDGAVKLLEGLKSE